MVYRSAMVIEANGVEESILGMTPRERLVEALARSGRSRRVRRNAGCLWHRASRQSDASHSRHLRGAAPLVWSGRLGLSLAPVSSGNGSPLRARPSGGGSSRGEVEFGPMISNAQTPEDLCRWSFGYGAVLLTSARESAC